MPIGRSEPYCRLLFQARIVQDEPNPDLGQETPRTVTLREGGLHQFDGELGMQMPLTVKMLAAAAEFCLNPVPEMAEKQVALLNATLANLEFVVAEDDAGRSKLTSRQRKPVS